MFKRIGKGGLGSDGQDGGQGGVHGPVGFSLQKLRHQLLGRFPPSTTCSKKGNTSSVKTCLPRGHILWESLQVKVTSRNVERSDYIMYRIVKTLLYEA